MPKAPERSAVARELHAYLSLHQGAAAVTQTSQEIVGLLSVACIALVPLLMITAVRGWHHRWLAGRAARRRADGSRGILARLALRRLVRTANDHSSHTAVRSVYHVLGGSHRDEAGWQRWLDNPTDRGWVSLNTRLLERGRPVWRNSAPSPDSLRRLFAEAVAPSRDAPARERLGEFCARHGLAPQNPAERAVFFLLSGQLEQYRAEDPDGLLVAAAYQPAGEARRAAVREAALATGDLNLLRALAQRPQLPAELTGEQAGRLVGELAAHGEWPRLWRLALDGTLEQALAVAPLLAGWQPPGEAGGELLGLLQDAGPGLVPAARATLRAAPPAGLPALRVVTSVSFAPDLSQVAVASHTGGDAVQFLGEQAQAAVEVFALPAGERVWRITSDRWLTQSVLHLGDVVVAAELRHFTRGQLRPSACRLVSYRGRSRKLLWRRRMFQREGRVRSAVAWDLGPRGWSLAPAQSGTGFAAVDPLGGGLLLGSGRRRAQTRTRAWLGDVLQSSDRVRLDTDPGSGRMALMSDSDLVLLDGTGRVLASRHSGANRQFQNAAPFFCGPDTLITAGLETVLVTSPVLRLWRLDVDDSGAGTLNAVGSQLLGRGHYHKPVLVVLPAAGLVACRGVDGQVSWFDSSALNSAAAPPGMPDGPVDDLWASPGGEYLAVAADGRVHVCQPWPGQAASLLTRPMAAMGPADLEAAAELERTEPNSAVRQAMGLLRACLEYRIGSEAALDDDAAAGRAGADDVGLAPGRVTP